MLTAYINKTSNINIGLRVSALNINSKSSTEGFTKNVDPDLAYVESAKNGNVNAFRELVEKYQQRAFSIALGVVKNEADAEDIAQEAFVKAHRNLPSFRGDSSFYTWFYRIVFNLAIDLSRKKYRHTETSIPEEKDIKSKC